MPFIAGLLIGNLTGFLLAILCRLLSELDDEEEKDKKE